MKKSFFLSAVLLSFSAVSQAAIIWSDTYSSGRETDVTSLNPYSFTGKSGNDYNLNSGANIFTVSGGVFNILDDTTNYTSYISVASNRFSTTTFNAGDQITVSVDIRVNSLAAGAGNSVPRFSIYTGNGDNGSEALTVGYGYGTFTGQQTAGTMGFYKGGTAPGSVGANNGIGIGSAGFNFGSYDSGTAANNGTNDTWYRISITMTQGQQDYIGSITNLTTSDAAGFGGAMSSALNWGDNADGGVRLITGQGGTSNFDIDNLIVTHVPEPSSVALFGGLGVLALLRRRRA